MPFQICRGMAGCSGPSLSNLRDSHPSQLCQIEWANQGRSGLPRIGTWELLPADGMRCDQAALSGGQHVTFRGHPRRLPSFWVGPSWSISIIPQWLVSMRRGLSAISMLLGLWRCPRRNWKKRLGLVGTLVALLGIMGTEAARPDRDALTGGRRKRTASTDSYRCAT